MSSIARFRNAIRISQLCARGTPPFPKQMINLCNWYVRLVRPGKEIPDDQFQCIVPMKMTKFDIRNYFEKIYSIRVKKVNTRIQKGKVKMRTLSMNTVRPEKTPDYKVAYVTMMWSVCIQQFSFLFEQSAGSVWFMRIEFFNGKVTNPMVDQTFTFPDIFAKERNRFNKEAAGQTQTQSS